MPFLQVLINLVIAIAVCGIILMILKYALATLWPSAPAQLVNIVYAIIGLGFFVYFLDACLPLFGFHGPQLFVYPR